MTDHLDESTTIGTREMAGSEATRFRKRVITAAASSIQMLRRLLVII